MPQKKPKRKPRAKKKSAAKKAAKQPDKPRLLWHSNAPHVPTGYGSQTALFTPRLNEHFEVGISAFYGLEGAILPWNNMPVYPGMGGTTHGNETIREHAETHFGGSRNGTVITLLDVWTLEPLIWREQNVASWVPIDHEPAPEPVLKFLRETPAMPIAMSRFGERMLKAANIEPLYVPHAVDTKRYQPIDQAQSRKKVGLPKDAFVVGMVAANKGNSPSRKCFPEALTAFKIFKDAHPEAVLYLHTEANGMFDGVNIPKLCKAIGLDMQSVLFPDQYRIVHYPFPAEHMAQVYSSFDVLLSPSAGEGFGIPVIEAQACGTPVIVSDFSAQPELVGAGWTVEGRPFYTPLQAFQQLPDVSDILDALVMCHGLSDGQRTFHRGEARKFAVEGYDVEHVMAEYMLPAVNEIVETFGKPPGGAA